MIFPTNRKYVHCGIKVKMKILMIKSRHVSCLQVKKNQL